MSTESNIVRSTLPEFEYPNISVAEYLANSLTRQHPNAIAIIDPKTEKQLSYGALHASAQKMASALVQLGITKRDVIMFYAENCIEYCIAMFAAVYLGVTFTQFTPANGVFELSQQMTDAHVTCLVFGTNKAKVVKKAVDAKEYSPALGQLKILIELTSDQFDDYLGSHKVLKGKHLLSYEKVLNMGCDRPLQKLPYYAVDSLETDRFFICYTSGTTGKPKGAIHSNRSYLATMMNLRLPSHFSGLKFAMPFPLGHVSGTIFLPQALDAGMTVVLFDTSDVDTIVEAIDRYRIEHYFFTANAANGLALTDYSAKYDLSCLRIFRYGSSKIAGHLLEAIKSKFDAEMWHLYGATEFMGSVAVVDVSCAKERFQPDNLGQVLSNVEMKIVDLATGQALPANEHGEICFRGQPCFIGYLNNEQATKSTIDADGWYHSGDVGYYNENGNLFISDRIKEMIKFRIWSVSSAEVEDFLHRHPAVEAVCVVGVPHVTDGNHIRAYVKLADGKQVTEQELILSVKENMGFQKQLLAGVRFIAQMPRTAVGKIDRQYFKLLVKDELLNGDMH